MNIFARLFCSKNHSTNDEACNVVESMAKAKPLYKELIKQAHPDKHPNNKDAAEELTAMGSSSNLVVISFLFHRSSSFLILLKVVDMFAF